MSDVLRRPKLRGGFCQVSNRIARIPTRGTNELWAQKLLIARISLPDEVDDFTGYAVNQLSVPRNSYYRAMLILAEWGFVKRTQRAVGKHDYEWTTEVRWGADGRPVSDPTGHCTVPQQVTAQYPSRALSVPQQGTVPVPQQGTVAEAPTTSIATTLLEHELLVGGWLGESRPKGDPEAGDEDVDAGDPGGAAGPDPRWGAAALAYEEHYLAAVANVPASKASGRLSADDRAKFDRLLSSGVPVEELCETVSGMVLEYSQGNRWRADTPEGGFWHPLVFRRRNRVKYAEMWRRQSAAESAGDDLRSRFGRLGTWR